MLQGSENKMKERLVLLFVLPSLVLFICSGEVITDDATTDSTTAETISDALENEDVRIKQSIDENVPQADNGESSTPSSPSSPSEDEFTNLDQNEDTGDLSTTTQVTSEDAVSEDNGDANKLSGGEPETTPLAETVSSDETPETNQTTAEREKRLSEMIREVIKYYKERGVVTLPGADVPDPMSVPDMKKSIAGTPASFSNMNVHGLSNFAVDHVNTDLDKMQVYVAVFIRKLVILGNYSLKSWFTRGSGPFNITLLYVEASGAAALDRNENGDLYATDSQMDMSFLEARVDFKNLGVLGTLFQGVVASAAPILFEGIKPAILTEINTKIRDNINSKIKTIGDKFATNKSAQPVEIALTEARKMVKEKGYDPFHIGDYVIKHKAFGLNISNFVLEGLSNFYKVGDISLSMDNGTIQMGLHLATINLKGRCKWTFTIGNNWQKSGNTDFSVSHLQIRAYVNQSIDIRQHPVLEDLDINVGKIKLNMKGTGNLDTLISMVVNTLPDLLRHIIVDAIEEPLKVKVQDIFNNIDMEEVLDRGLPELDKIGL